MILKRNLLSLIIVALLLMTLLLSIALFSVSLAKNFRIKSEVASKCEAISEFTERNRMPIIEESIIFLTEKRDKLKNIYSRFKLALASPLEEEVPSEELDPLKFKERLIQTQKRLRKDAGKHNLSLPESLGFAKYETALSEPSEITDLIRRLKVLEELVYTMIFAGVGSLDEIRFANKGVKKDVLPLLDTAAAEGGDIYFDVPVSFRISCASLKLIDFLYRLKSSSFVFIIDDLDIDRTQTSSDKDEAAKRRLKASLSIRAIALN